MRLRVARSARRHKVSAGRIREALKSAVLIREEDDAAVYVGTDERGLEIEMVVVSDDRVDGGLTVIHAMPTSWRRR